MSEKFLRWPKVAERQGESVRNCKRRSYNPDDPFPLAVSVSPQVSVIVDSEHRDYQVTLIAARRGDEAAQRRLVEMVERKKAIFSRQNGTPTDTLGPANGHETAENGAERPAGTCAEDTRLVSRRRKGTTQRQGHAASQTEVAP